MMPHKPQPVVFPARRVKAEKPFNDGLTAMYRQNYKQAARNLGRAVRIDPSYEKAWMFQGDAYMELGNYQQAIASYDKAIERHKTFSRLYTSRGKAYAAAGKYQEAIADYDRALEVYPEDPTPYYYRGRASYQLGDYDGADRDWQGAIDRFWKFYQAYQARADMRLKRGDLAGALADYQAGIDYAKGDRNSAVASYFQGQIAQIQQQTNFLAQASSSQTAISSHPVQAGAILSKLGNYSQVLEGLWKRVLQIPAG
jgi:tetratricopeptide (TPR) repeat protein